MDTTEQDSGLMSPVPSMDVVGSLRKLANECIDIGVELGEPFEIVAKNRRRFLHVELDC